MIHSGCTAEGSLNNSKFNDPMPWIGIYVAAAALISAVAMAMDALHGFRYKKFWFPCKFFTLNATTLTVLAIAIKFSVDLNAAMPRRQDQLAKVSSSAFICMVMGNLLPSLGTMEDTELLMNIIALGILVVTAIVNICIQMGTGVIFEFWIEHGIIMLLMIVLLSILCSLSLAIPTKKYFLDITYEKKAKLAKKNCFTRRNIPVAERLPEDLGKYWMMAYTSSPQFVIGRSAPCSASGAFCLFNLLILAESILRTRLMPWSFRFCNGDSDYKWSTTVVLISQTVAVVVGTVSPAFRWFMTINFRCPTKAEKACKREFCVERYWIKRLLLWQVQPMGLRICNRRWRKFAHAAKFQIFGFCIRVQKGLVFSCKMIRFVSIFFVGRFLRLMKLFNGENSVSNTEETNFEHDLDTNLSRYVIYLDGEEGLVDLMIKNNSEATSHWIKIGEKKQPRNLIKFLENSCSLNVFNGVREFDSDKVPSLSREEPPNCWALPIVTLTSIAVAIPTINQERIDQLVSGVDEGLKYVSKIENHLDEKKELKHVRKTAEVVWSGVELYNKWLDVDLGKLAEANQEHGKKEIEIIKLLSDISKEKFMEFGDGNSMFMGVCLKEIPSRWPMKMLAANSMYRVCETLLLTTEMKDHEKLFEKISVMICNILTAALTNLQQVITSKCHQSPIEERENSIRSAVLLFGKTKRILEVIDRKGVEDSDHGRLIHIDDWHLVSKQMNPLCSMTSSTDPETVDSSPSDLSISIE